MITNEKLLEYILQYAEELGVTGYDIGKNTSVSDQSAYKILRGETKNPRRKNLLEIWDYLERKQLGMGHNTPGIKKVEEPSAEYEKDKSTQEKLEDALRQLIKAQETLLHAQKELNYYRRLLEKNNIPFEETF